MELTPEQAEQRLNNPRNLANRLKEFRKPKKMPLDDVLAEMAAKRKSATNAEDQADKAK